ncbi:hypothetical protein CVU37_05965 [candidate division BRC1 bacterium HGW-BRC1-1]|jgi:uncharacterized protein (TIGR00661 family)|nr:MAG: hypothetical protein CVU37_05965 [candidate division BRC1 bacterium HGW-BRC1-1]
MRVFCGVQATGRGHLSRFAVVKEILESRGHSVFGYATGRDLPPYARGIDRFDVGPSFFIRGNRIDLPASFRHNAPLLFRVRGLLRDVTGLVSGGDFDEWIIDFEPISARAVIRAKKPFTIFDNQTLALMEVDVPDELRSTQRFMRRFVCAYYGNYAAARRILTYSLLPLEPQLRGQVIVPPCVREAVRAMTPEVGGHMLFYASIGELPAGLVEFARANPQAEIRAYFVGAETATGLPTNIRLPAPGGPDFLADFATCKVYVSNAGFESVAEAVTFCKPMVVVPIGGQAEQRLNAALIESHGVGLAGKDFSRTTFETAWHHDQPPAEDICRWVAKGRQGLEAALLG